MARTDGADATIEDKKKEKASSTIVMRLKLGAFYVSPDSNSLEATIARMTACDGLPFRVFTSSTDLRRVLMAAGFAKYPSHPLPFKIWSWNMAKRSSAL